MSFENAYNDLKQKGFADRVQIFEVSSATVELAALALGTEPAHIAKSLTFLADGAAVMIICAGDVKINNSKFKALFHEKAKMLTREQVTELIGHDVGGVCPFGIKPGVRVFTDESLKRFEYVYPACGNAASAVKLTPDELFTLSGAENWVDACVPMA